MAGKRIIWLKTERGYIKSCLNEDGPAGLIWARQYKADDPIKHPYLIVTYVACSALTRSTIKNETRQEADHG